MAAGVKVPERWKWLFQPLRPVMRNRLELCLGVVLSGAAVVALSTVIHVDPARLAAKSRGMEMPGSSERSAESELRAVPAPAPKVAPEFAHAVARGDLDTMNRLYVPNMALDGMLALAAESGEKPVAIWLLDHGANVKEDEGTIDSPLLLADAHAGMVELLIERGVPEPSLGTAAEANAPNAVARLLAAHAPVNPPDSMPLSAAVSSTRGTEETRQAVVEKLLVAGADPNREIGETALNGAARACDDMREQRAATRDCVAMMQLLVKHKARTKGDVLTTVLGIADEGVRNALLEVLLAAPFERGATATALASPTAVPTPLLKKLAAKGIDWAWHDGEDDAALPLQAAILRGDRDYARELLDLGAPANVRFKDTTSPLGAAIEGASGGGSPSYERVVELLLARGVDVNRRLPDGRTPLFAAAEGGSLRVVIALLEHGARVNDVVLDSTALDAAEQSNNQPIARVLHAHGARRARKNGDGNGER